MHQDYFVQEFYFYLLNAYLFFLQSFSTIRNLIFDLGQSLIAHFFFGVKEQLLHQHVSQPHFSLFLIACMPQKGLICFSPRLNVPFLKSSLLICSENVILLKFRVDGLISFNAMIIVFVWAKTWDYCIFLAYCPNLSNSKQTIFRLIDQYSKLVEDHQPVCFLINY